MLHSLGVPFFHHELVRQAAVLAIEKPAGTALLVELLSSLSDSGDLSPQQLHKGLTRSVMDATPPSMHVLTNVHCTDICLQGCTHDCIHAQPPVAQNHCPRLLVQPLLPPPTSQASRRPGRPAAGQPSGA